MRPIGMKRVFLTGTRRTIERTVYIHGGKYFIRWYNSLIEVYQRDGFPNATSGWMPVEQY